MKRTENESQTSSQSVASQDPPVRLSKHQSYPQLDPSYSSLPASLRSPRGSYPERGAISEVWRRLTPADCRLCIIHFVKTRFPAKKIYCVSFLCSEENLISGGLLQVHHLQLSHLGDRRGKIHDVTLHTTVYFSISSVLPQLHHGGHPKICILPSNNLLLRSK